MLCSKISKSLYCLSRVKNFVNPESLRKLYLSMIHSNLSYRVSVYGCENTTNLEKLRKMQKKPSVLYAMPITELIQLHFSKNKKFFHSINLLNSRESNLCIVFILSSFQSPLLKLGSQMPRETLIECYTTPTTSTFLPIVLLEDCLCFRFL